MRVLPGYALAGNSHLMQTELRRMQCSSARVFLLLCIFSMPRYLW